MGCRRLAVEKSSSRARQCCSDARFAGDGDAASGCWGCRVLRGVEDTEETEETEETGENGVLLSRMCFHPEFVHFPNCSRHRAQACIISKRRSVQQETKQLSADAVSVVLASSHVLPSSDAPAFHGRKFACLPPSTDSHASCAQLRAGHSPELPRKTFISFNSDKNLWRMSVSPDSQGDFAKVKVRGICLKQ